MARYITSSKKQRERQEKKRLKYEQTKEEKVRLRQANEHKTKRPRPTGRNKRRRRETEESSSCISSDEVYSEVDDGGDTGTGRRRNARANPEPQSNNSRHFAMINNSEEDEDRFYVIEKLLDKRMDKYGNEQYLVRWQNYQPEHDTWEPRNELEKNSMDLINDFNRIRRANDSAEELYCICMRPYKSNQGGMIQCFYCNNWYHFSCLQMNMVEANSYAKYHCQQCRKAHPELKNVIKREKVKSLFGNTPLVDIESDTKDLDDDEEFTV